MYQQDSRLYARCMTYVIEIQNFIIENYQQKCAQRIRLAHMIRGRLTQRCSEAYLSPEDGEFYAPELYDSRNDVLKIMLQTNSIIIQIYHWSKCCKSWMPVYRESYLNMDTRDGVNV